MGNKRQPDFSILKFISDFVNEKGYPPSMREIAGGTSYSSTSAISHHLGLLEEYGYIGRTPKIDKGIWVTDKGKEVMRNAIQAKQ